LNDNSDRTHGSSARTSEFRAYFPRPDHRRRGALALGVFKPKPHIALITSSDTAYWDRVIDGANKAADLYDVKLTIVRSKPNADEQTKSIQDLLSQQLDGIAISPINPSVQSGVLLDAANKTTLVTFDSDMPAPAASVSSARITMLPVGAAPSRCAKPCPAEVKSSLPPATRKKKTPATAARV